MINLLNTSTSNMMIVLFSCSKSTPGQTTTNAQAMTSQLQVTNPNAQVSESFKHVSELLDHVSTSHSTMIQHIQVRVVNLDVTTMSTNNVHKQCPQSATMQRPAVMPAYKYGQFHVHV